MNQDNKTCLNTTAVFESGVIDKSMHSLIITDTDGKKKTALVNLHEALQLIDCNHV